MKKFLCQSITILAVSSQLIAYPAFSLSITGFEAAEKLANDGIITKKYDTNGYQLQKSILRQEAVGIIGKASGTVVGDDANYNCRQIFGDVNEGWVCRSVEIAADAGIINKGNAKFRPKDNVSYFEAAVMALKSSCLNPNHSLSGSTDQERIIERAREAGIYISRSSQQKNITRGEFFRFITLARDFVTNNPNQVDVAQPACVQWVNHSIGDFTMQIPANWEKNDEVSPNNFQRGVYFDEKQVGAMRFYVREYSIDVTPGIFYENSRNGFLGNENGRILSEKNGSIFGSKMIRHQYKDVDTGESVQNFSYFVPNGDKMYEVIFAYSPIYFVPYQILMERIFSSAKITGIVTNTQTNTNTQQYSQTTPQEGDTVSISYKKSTDSGRVNLVGDSVFKIGSELMVTKIEDAVKAMHVGETRTVRTVASEAYGEKKATVTMSPGEFEEFKTQMPLGITKTFDKGELLGKMTKTISKEVALATFGQISLGKEIRESNITQKIITVGTNDVTIEFENPNALFYQKSMNVGDKATVDDVTFTIQSINGIEVTILMNFGYNIVSQTSSEVVINVTNTHPFAGENFNYEITLKSIQKN